MIHLLSVINEYFQILKGGDNMKVKYEYDIVNSLEFNNNTSIYIDKDLGVFLGNYNKNLSELKISSNSNRLLLRKFKVKRWDIYTEGLFHIKFAIKYSPVLSKIIGATEFNSIEYCSVPLGVCYNNNYINIKNYGKFFCINDVITNSSDIRISSPKKFKQYLKLDRRNPTSFR